MPPSLLNPYLRRTMGAAVVRLPIQSSFLRDTLFSRSFVFGTPDIDIDLVMPRRGIAPFVHPSLPGKTMGNTGFTMKSYTPPYVKPKRIITAADIFKRAPGIDIYQESDALNGVLAELLGERWAANMDEFANRLEWMAAQATFFGQYQVTGDGYDHLIDFQLPTSHNIAYSGVDLWNALDGNGKNTGKPLSHLQSAASQNRDDGAVVSDIAIFASDAWAAFKENSNTLKFFTNLNNITLGSINPIMKDKSTTYCGTYRDADTCLDLYVYSGFYTGEDGSVQRYVPSGHVFVGSTQATGNQELYGAIQDLGAQAQQGVRQKCFCKLMDKTDEDPSSIEILCQSAPLVALLEPKAGTVLKVL